MRVLSSLFTVVLALSWVDADLCPNGKDTCPSTMTCCPTLRGNYGCCPYKGAMCCPDHIHCCPAGTKCNTSSQTCDGVGLNTSSLDWMVPTYGGNVIARGREEAAAKEEARGKLLGKNKCPDGNTCPESSTCCKMPQGNFGCCPYPKGTCCPDKEHCCPKDYKCDIENDQCILKSHLTFTQFSYDSNPKVVPLFSLVENKFLELSTSCRPRNLCVLSGYLCCPGGGSTSDYCCVRGTVCGGEERVCVKENRERVSSLHLLESLNIFATTRILPAKNPVKDSENFPGEDLAEFPAENSATKQDTVSSGRISCPNLNDECPGGHTCCQVSAGNFACCPYLEAVCCPDTLMSCCPKGYVCGESGCERTPSFLLFHLPLNKELTGLLRTGGTGE